MSPPREGRGVPRAVQKSRKDTGLPPLEQVRESWMLELVAWQRHGRTTNRLDLHGHRSTRPPIWLDTPEALICLDFLDALRDLRSRPRAFSQQAGRYTDAVQGAQLHHKALHIELYLLEDEPHEADHKLAEALAKYLNATITLHGRQVVHTALQVQFPPELVEHNPLAWTLDLARKA